MLAFLCTIYFYRVTECRLHADRKMALCNHLSTLSKCSFSGVLTPRSCVIYYDVFETCSIMFSTVKPYSSMTLSPFAEAPNISMPMIDSAFPV